MHPRIPRKKSPLVQNLPNDCPEGRCRHLETSDDNTRLSWSAGFQPADIDKEGAHKKFVLTLLQWLLSCLTDCHGKRRNPQKMPAGQIPAGRPVLVHYLRQFLAGLLVCNLLTGSCKIDDFQGYEFTRPM